MLHDLTNNVVIIGFNGTKLINHFPEFYADYFKHFTPELKLMLGITEDSIDFVNAKIKRYYRNTVV